MVSAWPLMDLISLPALASQILISPSQYFFSLFHLPVDEATLVEPSRKTTPLTFSGLPLRVATSLAAAISQTLTVRSRLAVAMNLPSPLITRALIQSPCPLSSLTGVSGTNGSFLGSSFISSFLVSSFLAASFLASSLLGASVFGVASFLASFLGVSSFLASWAPAWK